MMIGDLRGRWDGAELTVHHLVGVCSWNSALSPAIPLSLFFWCFAGFELVSDNEGESMGEEVLCSVWIAMMGSRW